MSPEHFCLIMAIWEISVGVPLLLRREPFLRWVEEFTQNTTKVRVLFFTWLVIGVLAISENPKPAWDLNGILSLLAWVTTIKCAIGVFRSESLIRISVKIMKKAPPGIGILVLGIGGMLIYAYLLLQS